MPYIVYKAFSWYDLPKRGCPFLVGRLVGGNHILILWMTELGYSSGETHSISAVASAFWEWPFWASDWQPSGSLFPQPRDCGRSRFILQKSPRLAIFKMDTTSSGEDWLCAWYRPVPLMGICCPNIIRFRETSFCTLEALGLAPQSHIQPQKSTKGPWVCIWWL